MSNQEMDKVVAKFSVEYEADVLLFSDEISNETADELIAVLSSIREPKPNIALILTTPGGVPDAAFRIARFLQRNYKKFILLVFGFCKSAGTLIALGADEIVMSDYGELGPLDVQVSVTDDLVSRSSGLDIEQALNVISIRTFDAFGQYFNQLIQGSQGVISTRTAADIASSMAVNLLTPIAAQIDPLRLGEMNRVLRIAQEYGERLSARLDTKNVEPKRHLAITQLTSGYPDHGFVIDREEASTWLENVRDCSEIDAQLATHLFGATRRPINAIALLYPNLNTIQEPDKNVENTEGDTKSADSSGSTKEAVSKDRRTKKNTSPDPSTDDQATSDNSNQSS
jgi:hypothetical protein